MKTCTGDMDVQSPGFGWLITRLSGMTHCRSNDRKAYRTADDRGWHLLAVLARVSHLAGRELQRVALSATIGNPNDVLTWLTTGCSGARHVINPVTAAGAPPDITLDYVGNLANAALVISRLHRGEKRLVFVDSRARAEQLAAALRSHQVDTFVSHGSLGLNERRQAEQAFAEARNCVIVATSTLELGIDVGDLDRVLQIDAPGSVTSFLQRLGRTGRRAGTSRNMTLLATSDDAMLQAASVLLRWDQGYVEPTTPPPAPMHLLGQQLLALTLQEGQIGRHTWREWFGTPFVFGPEVAAVADEVIDHLIAEGFLVDTGAGMLSIGTTAEAEFGRRHFMELLAVFTAPPLFSVRHGRTEIGLVPDEVLLTRPPREGAQAARVLLLAGKSWMVTSVDWKRRVIQVEPTDQPGVARWQGGGAALGPVVARGVRNILTGACPVGVTVSARATDRLDQLRLNRGWVARDTTTVIVEPDGRTRWWTFAGRRANIWLAEIVSPLRKQVSAFDDLSISLDPNADVTAIRALLDAADLATLSLTGWISEEAISQLKFSECLLPALAIHEVEARLRNDATVLGVIREAVRVVHLEG